MSLKRLIKGARYSDKYGSHPGTIWLINFVSMGAIAGAQSGGLAGSLGGAAFMAVFLLPLWLIGCWERGDE